MNDLKTARNVKKYTVQIFSYISNPIDNNVELFNQPILMHNFLYSITICLLHYYPRHVSSINMPIFRRKNCIHTASGIYALCKRLHSTLVESRLQSALNQCVLYIYIYISVFTHKMYYIEHRLLPCASLHEWFFNEHRFCGKFWDICVDI